MVKVEPFAVEQWMDEYETTPGVLNVAETCASSISVDELVQLSTDAETQIPFHSDDRLTYGAIRGSEQLRAGIASLYSEKHGDELPPNDIIVAQGAINANFLALYTLIGPGDHVVCVYPTYQQLYSVPSSLGAEVTLWRLREDNGYIPDLVELESLVKENTKMIIINNPNNPTGAPITESVLRALVDFARKKDIILFSDEVYRPLWHSLPAGTKPPPSVLSLGYEKCVVTGSMSKAFALAGIRVGWIASRDEHILAAVAAARDYTTISVSKVDDRIASYALSTAVQSSLLHRNVQLAAHNLGIVRAFMDKYAKVCSWVQPWAGTTAFVQIKRDGTPVDDTEFCLDLLRETKVLVVPGSRCFGDGSDFTGFIRLGYVCETSVLEEALEALGKYLERHLL